MMREKIDKNLRELYKKSDFLNKRNVIKQDLSSDSKFKEREVSKRSEIHLKKSKLTLEVNEKKKHIRKCVLILVLSSFIFILFFTIYSYELLYGSIPWMNFETWSNSAIHKEYSIPKIIKKSKSISLIEKLNLISPFVNGTFLKTKLLRYGNPIFEFVEIEKSCKHYINYDITIPPGMSKLFNSECILINCSGGWIIYSSCSNSIELPRGYNSIRAIGYSPYGNNINVTSPLEIKEWYHGYYSHIQIPILITE